MFEFFANGITEICGSFTEYQGGCVLGTTAEQVIRAFAKPNGTDTVHIESEDFGNFDIEIGDSEPRAEEAETPAAFVRGIMNCFIESGNIFGGFDAKIISEIPYENAISYFTAFEILIGKIISGLFFEKSVPAFRLAEFGRIAENDYFGNPCGIAEKLICAFGGTVFVDFSNPEMPQLRNIGFDFSKSGYSAAVIDCGENKEKFEENSYGIIKDMSFAAWNMGHTYLSEGDEAELIAQFPILRQKCGEKTAFRALCFYEETRTAQEEAEVLENGDFEEFLRIFMESAESSGRKLYGDETENLSSVRKLLCGKGAVKIQKDGTFLAFVKNENAADFAEEAEKLGFGIMFLF